MRFLFAPKPRPDIAKQGQKGEAWFRKWLDRDKAAYHYVDQSQETYAVDFAGTSKRPDFLVGYPTVGTIAIDVKVKTSYKDTFILDVQERDALAGYEFAFHLSAWFAIYEEGKSSDCWLVPNNLLHLRTPENINGTEAFRLHKTRDLFYAKTYRESFYDALHRILTKSD